ncbi:MAG: endolytic transglycosylase MltG [Bacteroidota bacterium]|nr:endolytic transglycosylase MltG [Bacteroidota bacterium]MDP4232558.1 endolytic transglycosylase MltG [Bacteroidota bacterium]MDP4242987.1 endolytic transglycosylase MltG [Bacteroidota bacterium]MDP4286438.1 endolytic transglycosylase MltG [Bacteroidota bacterium]
MKIRAILILVVICAALAAYYVFFLKNPKLSDKEEVVIVPRGVSVSALADSMATHHLVRSRWAFQIAARTLGSAKKLHAGLYRIAPGLSNSEILRRLTGSEYALVLQATFPEGITMYRTASIAHDKLGLDSGIFMRFAMDSAFLHSLGADVEARTAEGYLFPDTYEFLLSADPKGLITRMVKRWKKIVADSLYAQSDEEDLSLNEVMTLASIVEAEARRPEERDTIAGVYLNRLRIGMKLDADPSVQYGLHLTRPITHHDLETPNPYNTYQNKGLPPGPICSPGAASVRAVLHPAKHPYLYFVARRDGSGGHYFSRTLAEQDRKIAMARTNAASEP